MYIKHSSTSTLIHKSLINNIAIIKFAKEHLVNIDFVDCVNENENNALIRSLLKSFVSYNLWNYIQTSLLNSFYILTTTCNWR